MFRKSAEKLAPLWAVVGLGNPGGEYARTRHNVGWEVLDLLAERHKVKLTTAKHKARYGVGRIEETPVALVKPMTFMNLSGQAVKPLLAEFGLAPDRLIVVADDLDLPTGKLRMREGGSHGGHNGHRSIIATLGTSDYPRLKIGIGSVDKSQTVDHVLSRFTPDEREGIARAVERAADAVEILIAQGPNAALTFANS